MHYWCLEPRSCAPKPAILPARLLRPNSGVALAVAQTNRSSVRSEPVGGVQEVRGLYPQGAKSRLRDPYTSQAGDGPLGLRFIFCRAFVVGRNPEGFGRNTSADGRRSMPTSHVSFTSGTICGSVARRPCREASVPPLLGQTQCSYYSESYLKGCFRNPAARNGERIAAMPTLQRNLTLNESSVAQIVM